jgi:hypothetical protein
LRARASLAKHFLAPTVSLTVVALAMAGTLASHPDETNVLLSLLITLVMAGLFCALGYWRARLLVRRSELVVELGAGGLTLQGLLGKTVPWSEVVAVNCEPPFRAGTTRGIPGVYVSIRGLGRFAPHQLAVFGSGENGQLVLPAVLNVSARRLHHAIEAHRAHFGRSGRPLETTKEQVLEAA